MINRLIKEAYAILNGNEKDKSFFHELSQIGDEDILDLVALSSKVKNRHSPDYHTCTIMNARSNLCAEDCRFCAQSQHYNTGTETFELVPQKDILLRAEETYGTGVRSFGIVTSGTGYLDTDEEFMKITSAIDEIHNRFPDMKVCASLGHLSEITAKELARHDISHYNINIQTNPDRYRDLVSATHDVDDRISTIRLLKKHGIQVCSGGIIGLGESMSDRIELAFILKDLDVDVLPLNVLIPIPGTPLEDATAVPATDVIKTVSLYRLINPDRIIKFAAGRETRMKDFQALLMLAGANGFITGGYLTTRGREVSDDMAFLNELENFKIK